ncbi:hypothetical protein SASPL_139476 [Salvia splendens]|uniref:Agglutinin domain-containing protein n=1 Tax=Salvia splendens TaxID=180675 RepID=A0A8X8WQC9_SALSN|nr:uncharacterized protein LOC121768207 [Salvia splendens]KAG6398026.1 hypothetical protein SASPL_139476 [Salvia splendens]
MSEKLTRFIVITFTHFSGGRCAVRDEVSKSVVMGTQSKFSERAKIEVEPSSINERYVHLRFSSSNRYWQRNPDNNLIVAESIKPVEHLTDPSSTLFEQLSSDKYISKKVFFLRHVQTGHRVVGDADAAGSPDPIPLHVAPNAQDDEGLLEFVNWSTLVKLPSHVAFKGFNQSYLKGIWAEHHHYLQFAAEDRNSVVAGHRVFLQPNGSLRIKSDYFNMYWQYGYDWIYASNQDPGPESNTLFWPVRVDGDTIALRCNANNRFCKSHDYKGKNRCLNAAVDTIVNEARMTVEELVTNRTISQVKYRMEDARIYDVIPYLAGSTTATNHSNLKGGIGVQLTYQDSKSYTFSRSTSLTAGVKATIKAGIPFIVDESIEVSFEATETLEWDTAKTITTTVTATGSVEVDPRTIATVHYVASMGKCDIPYSYTQSEQSSTDGTFSETGYEDGIYTGVSCYNFDFVIDSTKPLDPPPST